jgi:hypothetical protein
MDQIRKQVDRARRRLWLELFLGRLVKCWFVALLAAVVAVAVPRLVVVENLPAQWSAWWIGGALAAGTLVALIWTTIYGRTEFDAAVEIDRRFDLKERVASSLSLPAEALATPAGRALVEDAERAVKRIEIDERFRVRVSRAAWLPLVPAAIAMCLVGFVDVQPAQSSVAKANETLNPKVITNSTQNLRKKLADIAKKPPKKGLESAQALLLEMEKEVAKIAEKKDVNRQQAMVKINNLAQQLAERREKLGGDSELKRQMAGMKDLGRGPAEKMGEAMKNGDWKQASDELQKLADQLKDGKLDANAKRQLSEQLKKMEQQLADAAAKREQAIDDLKKKIEEQKQSGNLAEAGEMQQKLERMMKQQKQAQQLKKLAQQMAQAQQSMEKGDQQAAAQSISQMMQQLQEMQSEMERNSAESQMLDMAMEQLQMSKDAMACENCEGEGCAECEGMNAGRQMNEQMGNRGGNGMGYAEGGFGQRPEERTDTAFRDSQVRQNPRRGAAVITGEADGPIIRGDVREAVREEIATAETDDAEAMVIEQLPRTQRENAEDYFNRLRTGD